MLKELKDKTMNKLITRMFTVLILLVGMLSVISGHGQEQLSMETAILKGLKNNFQVRIFEEYYKSAQLDNTWGTVGRYPSISLGITSINRFDDAPSVQNPEDRSELYTNRVSPYVNVNWLLFDGFSVKINKEKLKLLEHYSAGTRHWLLRIQYRQLFLDIIMRCYSRNVCKYWQKLKNFQATVMRMKQYAEKLVVRLLLKFCKPKTHI